MWGWISKAKQFISSAIGKVFGRKEVTSISNNRLAGEADRVAGWASDLATGSMDVSGWEIAMRKVIKDNYIQQYLLGLGGTSQLKPFDFSSIGGMLADQYRYLSSFAQEIANGLLTKGQIAMRSRMYVISANEAFQRANARAHGIPEGSLPQHPGDGHTQCLTNCLCSWDIHTLTNKSEATTGWDCYWTLGHPKTEHCPDCLELAKRYAPFHVPAPAISETQVSATANRIIELL